jgi:5-methylcytosine-specific restriction endonuclease McrA
MRVIKLSNNRASGGFESEDEVAEFFRKKLHRRKGRFHVTLRKQTQIFHSGELLIFSYQKHCMFVARVERGIPEPGTSDFEASFSIRLNTIKRIDRQLDDLEKMLRTKGFTGNLVSSREWPRIDDAHEEDTVRFLQLPKSRPAFADSLTDLAEVPMGSKSPDRARHETTIFHRDLAIRQFVKARAAGRCEYCDESGFLLPDGTRYVETHHIIALANNGPDTLKNVIALCPKHHREAHFGAKAVALEKRFLKRLAEINAK